MNLSEAEFDDVNMSGVSFHNINMSKTTFHDINMSDITVSAVQLGGARFKHIGLPPCSKEKQRPLTFKEADLNGALIAKCDLSNVRIENCNVLAQSSAWEIRYGSPQSIHTRVPDDSHDPSAARPLYDYLEQPGVQGHMNPGDDPSTITGAKFGPALMELFAASALYRCGDFSGLGRKILTAYFDDWRGVFVRYAGNVLAERNAGGGESGIRPR